MTQKLHFNLQSEDQSPKQPATCRRDAMTAAKAVGRLRLDTEASIVLGYGVVVSVHKFDGEYLIVELDSVDEATAFVAEANGETEADVLATARQYAEYLHNVRAGKRVPNRGTDEDDRE